MSWSTSATTSATVSARSPSAPSPTTAPADISESAAVNAVIAQRAFDAFGPWSNDGKISEEEMRGDLRFREMLPFIDMAQELAGSDNFTVGQATFSDEPFAAVEAFHTGYVMLFTEKQFIVVLELTDFIE